MRTQIAITIDTEFSIGGAFADPERRRPIGEANVTCPVGGREQGLGFMLDTFARHGTRATFFTKRCRPPGSAMRRWPGWSSGSWRRGRTCNCTSTRAGRLFAMLTGRLALGGAARTIGATGANRSSSSN
jgi:hypothetical protein